MRSLFIPLVVVLGLACDLTGPNTATGQTSCQQLRECLCDPERNPVDPVACNMLVDGFEQGANPAQTCANFLPFNCRPVTVGDPAGF